MDIGATPNSSNPVVLRILAHKSLPTTSSKLNRTSLASFVFTVKVA